VHAGKLDKKGEQMSVSELKKATGLTNPKTRDLTFPDMLENFKSQIAAALPKHLNPDRMARIALTEFRKNPELGRCDPRTIFASIIIAAQLGLEPGVMGQAYLVPFKGVCTLIPGWQGYVDLVARAGRASVWTDDVHQGDRFLYTKGSSPSITHEPGDQADDTSPFTHVYAVGRIRGAEWPVIEVQSRNKVLNHLHQYNKQGQKHYALANENNLTMYGRKVALLQVIKYMPKSVELQLAANLDYAADAGTQTISVEEAIAGTFTPNGYQDEPQVLEAEPGTKDREQGAGNREQAHPVSPAEKPVEAPSPAIADLLRQLGWSPEVQAQWLKDNAKLDNSEMIYKLGVALDK
jgi:recombination protein RecT